MSILPCRMEKVVRLVRVLSKYISDTWLFERILDFLFHSFEETLNYHEVIIQLCVYLDAFTVFQVPRCFCMLSSFPQ